MENSVKLPVVALIVAMFLVLFAGASIMVRTSESREVARQGGGQGDVARGRQLFAQLGCSSCHNINGRDGAGPALNGLYNTRRELATGETVLADDEYLRLAILEPNLHIAEGYQPNVMTSGITRIMDRLRQGDTTDALVAYIKTLK